MKEALEVVRRHHQGEITTTQLVHELDDWGVKVVGYEELEYKLVTSEETDVAKGLVSTTSPIGRGLIGKKVGDTAVIVSPNGNREMEILKLTTIHEDEER